MSTIRFGFVTCVQLGMACMEEIYNVGDTLHLVITLPDEFHPQKSGRASPSRFCVDHGVPVAYVKNINDEEAVDAVRSHGIDWLYVIGWSQIVRREMLSAPKKGAIGMHPTLLPMGRGRAAIPWTILLGLQETGVTMFQLDEGVDTGPILAQERFPVKPDDTATTLYNRVADAHRTLMAGAHHAIASGAAEGIAQDESRATVWPARRPEDGRILPSMPLVTVDRLVRATTRPYPGAFWADGTRTLRVWAGTIADNGADHPNSIALDVADGQYMATDWEWE